MQKNLHGGLTDWLASETPEQKTSASSLATALPLSASSGKHHLLIISDSAESLARLKDVLMADDTEIACATAPEDMCRGCCGRQDLVVIDVGPERLGEILKTLRSCTGCANVPVLVEKSRISAAPDLAGLLPAYRAMPCGYSDLLVLARRRLSPYPVEHQTLRIL